MRFVLLLAPLGLAACAAQSDEPARIGMPNPASRYCVDSGGRLEIREGPAGQSGYCHLPDGRVVEEWALFRQDRGSE